MTRRVGPWIFAIAVAGVLYAFGIHRYSWSYEGILVGVGLVVFVIRRVSISVRRETDGPGEPSSPETEVEQVFHRTPGSEADPAGGDR